MRFCLKAGQGFGHHAAGVHLRKLVVGWHIWRWHQGAVFAISHGFVTAIKEKCDVRVFFGFSEPKLTAPRLSAGAWWRYLTNVASLSPVPDGLKFGEVPEGVLRLGGTFVVDDDTVRFAHADKFPGDHPAIADVLRAAGISLVDAEGVAV